MRRVVLLVAIGFLLVLVSCSAEPETVEVTRLVEVEVAGEVEAAREIEVTRLVEVEATRNVEVTRIVEAGAGEDTLQVVLDRGKLNCGANGSLPGFGFRDNSGVMQGFDADFCRAVAIAVLGDPDAISYPSTGPHDRFQLLESGAIDVLIRNTTWTLDRDTSMGFNFGQGQSHTNLLTP